MCSLVESRPLTRTITGAGRSSVAGAALKYAGRVVPSYGIATRLTRGLWVSNAFSAISSIRRYVGTRFGSERASIRSAWAR
jgi:hypothetical protein